MATSLVHSAINHVNKYYDNIRDFSEKCCFLNGVRYMTDINGDDWNLITDELKKIESAYINHYDDLKPNAENVNGPI